MSIVFILVCVFVSLQGAAGPVLCADSPLPRFTLQELIDGALTRNAEIEASQWQVGSAAARLRQARAAFFLPRLRLESETGIVPDAKGDLFNPPSDTTGVRPLGPFNRTKLEFVQPLYTFGQLSSLKQAAESGLTAEQAGLAQTRIEVAFQIKKLYYSVLLTQDLEELVERLSTTIEKKLTEVDVETVLSLADLYKLKLALLELEQQKIQIGQQRELAGAALAWQAGLPLDRPPALAATRLEPVEADLPSLEQLVEEALVRRPDWLQLQAGIAARQAQENAAQRAYYPQLFLAGGVRYAVAPGRTNQRNPFVHDGFNYFNAGAFVGVRQSFEWGLLSAEVARTRAVRRELEARERGAAPGIRLDVQRAYREFEQAEAAFDIAARRRQLGRQWLQQAEDEYEFDPDTLDDLISAFVSYATVEEQYHRAMYHFNMSLAELEKKAGGMKLSNCP